MTNQSKSQLGPGPGAMVPNVQLPSPFAAGQPLSSREAGATDFSSHNPNLIQQLHALATNPNSSPQTSIASRIGGQLPVSRARIGRPLSTFRKSTALCSLCFLSPFHQQKGFSGVVAFSTLALRSPRTLPLAAKITLLDCFRPACRFFSNNLSVVACTARVEAPPRPPKKTDSMLTRHASAYQYAFHTNTRLQG